MCRRMLSIIYLSPIFDRSGRLETSTWTFSSPFPLSLPLRRNKSTIFPPFLRGVPIFSSRLTFSCPAHDEFQCAITGLLLSPSHFCSLGDYMWFWWGPEQSRRPLYCLKTLYPHPRNPLVRRAINSVNESSDHPHPR